MKSRLNIKLSSSRSLVILCVILFLTFLDNTIVSVVLSNIQSNLAAGVQDLQWIVDAYMLSFAVFMLSGGTLGDMLGRKKVMLSGVGLFVAGSLVATFANSIDLLIASRVVMGIGAAASEPGTLSMIRHIFPEHNKRSRALGVWAAVSGIALAFGPIIGGVIIGFSNWRGVFVFSAVFGVIALIAGILFLPETVDRQGRKFDLAGLISGAAAISAVTVALILGQNDGYRSYSSLALFAAAVVSLILFWRIEHRSPDPVLPLEFFKNVHFSLANAVAFVANFGIFAVFFFVALYLQLIAGFSGYQIALAFLAMAAAMVVSAILAGRFHSARLSLPLSIAGCLISGIAVIILDVSIHPTITAIELSWILALAGVGFGICLVTMTSSVLGIVPAARSGMAASTVNSFRELGGVFGVAILGSIVNAQLTSHLSFSLRQLHLPTNFQSFVIYAITHGGHTPQGVHITVAELAAHASLVSRVTNAAYAAFSRGLSLALDIAGALLLLTSLIAFIIYLSSRIGALKQVQPTAP